MANTTRIPPGLPRRLHPPAGGPLTTPPEGCEGFDESLMRQHMPSNDRVWGHWLLRPESWGRDDPTGLTWFWHHEHGCDATDYYNLQIRPGDFIEAVATPLSQYAPMGPLNGGGNAAERLEHFEECRQTLLYFLAHYREAIARAEKFVREVTPNSPDLTS